MGHDAASFNNVRVDLVQILFSRPQRLESSWKGLAFRVHPTFVPVRLWRSEPSSGASTYFPLSLFRVLHFSGFLVVDSARSVVHYLVFPLRRDLFAASEFTLFWGQPFAVSQTAPTALQRAARCSKYFLFLLRSV